MKAGIYIDPPAQRLLEDRFFLPATGSQHSSLARCLASLKETFEARGIPVHTADLLPPPGNSARHLYVSIGNHENYARLAGRADVVLSAFLVTEAPVVEPRIYEGLPAAARYFKRIYSCITQDEVTEFAGSPVDCLPLPWPIDFRGVEPALWARSERAFLVMINMNKLPRLARYELFTERMRAVEFFSRTNDIDLYGIGWDKASVRMGHTGIPWTLRRAAITVRNAVDRVWPDPLLVAARKVYMGPLETKWETLSRYDFVLCFENTARKGWLTEKFFEALRVGTIPIYSGDTGIQERIPPDCFVDMREFGGYPELLRFLKLLDLAAIRRYRDAGRAFLESPAFEPFSKESFTATFASFLEQDAGVPVPMPQ